MAKQAKAPKITVGELKKVVGGLKSETASLQDKYNKTSNAMDSDIGLSRDFETLKMQDSRSRMMQHNMDKIKRYGRIADSATIVHDKARLAEKQAAFKRDYPLSPTFKSEMVAPTKKQTNKFPKGVVKGIVREGISEAVSTFKKKK